jgi:hypothetical protein
MGHGWQGFPDCLPEPLEFQKRGRLRDHVALLKGYEHLSSICDYDTAIPLLISQFNARELANSERKDGTPRQARKVLSEKGNPPAGIASHQSQVATYSLNRARARAKERLIGEAFKVALANVFNVVETLEQATQALVHKRNPKGLPVTKLISHSQSKYFQMISSCRGWETYPESLPRSWGSPLSQASVIRLYRLAQLCTSAEAEPLLQQQLESQSQTSRLSLLSIEAVRQIMMASRILCDMSTRDPGGIFLARARTASPDLDDGDTESDSAISSDHGFLDDHEPDAGAGCGSHNIQPDSSRPQGARGVPNSAPQVDDAGQLWSAAVPELVAYPDFTADSIDPGQLYYLGYPYQPAQSGVSDEPGLISQEGLMGRTDVVTRSRKRARVDSVMHLDSCMQHNIFEQFPGLELKLSKTPWCPTAPLKTRQLDTLPSYIDSSEADDSLMFKPQGSGQQDLDAWMGFI